MSALLDTLKYVAPTWFELVGVTQDLSRGPMKKTLAAATVLAALALTGCAPKAIEFKAAPETMPAVEAADLPTPSTGPASWDPENLEYVGASDDLEALARKSAQAVHDYSEENPDSPAAQLSFLKATANNSSNVEFSITNELTSAQLKQAANSTACAIVAEVPGANSDGTPWLGFLTLFSTKTGEKYMYSDTQLCE